MSKHYLCHICEESDPDKFVGKEDCCVDCEEVVAGAKRTVVLNTVTSSVRMARQNDKTKNQPRRKDYPTYICVADPQEGFLGSFFYEGEIGLSTKDGIMPSGSLWYNDHDEKVYEIWGELGKPQQLLVVGKERLKLLEIRFPRLRSALCNTGVY